MPISLFAPFDAAPVNLLTNGGFEIWQRGTSFPTMASAAFGPDRWQFIKAGSSALTVTQELVTVDAASSASAKLVYTHNAASIFQQKLEDFSQLRGLTLAVSLRVRANAASAVRLRIDDSVHNGTPGGAHSGDSTWQTLTAMKTIDPNAVAVSVVLELNASATIYLDNGMTNIGTTPTAYVPLHPAEEWARCLRYYELLQPSAEAFNPFASGVVESTSTARFLLRYQPKAVDPTFVTDTPGDYQTVYTNNNGVACTAITAGVLGKVSGYLVATVTGTPLTVGQAVMLRNGNTFASKLAIEANP